MTTPNAPHAKGSNLVTVGSGLWSIQTLMCKTSGKETKYIGEMAKIILERSKEH